MSIKSRMSGIKPLLDPAFVLVILIVNFLSFGVNGYRLIVEAKPEHLPAFLSGLTLSAWATYTLRKRVVKLQHDNNQSVAS